MEKVLVFTLVQKFGTKPPFGKDGGLTKTVKKNIQKHFGIQEEYLLHRRFYGAEAMNGSRLYIETASNDSSFFNHIIQSLEQQKISYRTELEQWLKNEGMDYQKSSYKVTEYDEYLIEFRS